MVLSHVFALWHHIIIIIIIIIIIKNTHCLHIDIPWNEQLL